MSSRAIILEALRRSQPPATPLPDLPTFPTAGDDPVGRFAEAVRALGGEIIEDAAGMGVAGVVLRHYPEAAVVASMLPGVASAGIRLSEVTDPHELAALDLFICEAEFGVAENGAVWLTDARLGHRAAPFLAEHVLVLLDRRSIVRDMHEACARAHTGDGGFGLFMAGPSKTADIEQALVIGAHGPKGLAILLTGAPA